MLAGLYGHPRTELEPTGVLPLCLLQDRLQPAGLQSLDTPSSSSLSLCAVVFWCSHPQALFYFNSHLVSPVCLFVCFKSFVFSSSFPHVHSWVIINKLLNVCSDTPFHGPSLYHALKVNRFTFRSHQNQRTCENAAFLLLFPPPSPHPTLFKATKTVYVWGKWGEK